MTSPGRLSAGRGLDWFPGTPPDFLLLTPVWLEMQRSVEERQVGQLDADPGDRQVVTDRQVRDLQVRETDR